MMIAHRKQLIDVAVVRSYGQAVNAAPIRLGVVTVLEHSLRTVMGNQVGATRVSLVFENVSLVVERIGSALG